MLKKNNIQKEIVEKNTTPLSQEIPVMPQAETSSQFDQVPRVATELAGVPTTLVLINSNHDTRKIPLSNLHLVGTPVKMLVLNKWVHPLRDLSGSFFSTFLFSCVLG